MRIVARADWAAWLAAWHLPGGPVGPPSGWAATSNVEIGQTTYPVNRERVEMRPVASPYSRGVLYGVLNQQTIIVFFGQ